ncbi:MAG: sugar phosphate nucleotidyltransferase [Bacteroidota bacterium]
MRNFAIVIMAAGKGTRMKDPNKAKVMFEISGKPLVAHVIDLAQKFNPQKIISIVGFQKESVSDFINSNFKDVECVNQEPQLGTGHAIMQTENSLKNFDGDVLVLSGDVPNLKFDTIDELQKIHISSDATATILSTMLENPFGYGRILRNNEGFVTGIVEQKDACDLEKEVKEINSGIYLFDSKNLFEALKHINSHNSQNEFYLTDVFSYFWKENKKVNAYIAKDCDEVRGINTIEQLEEAEITKNKNVA